MSVEFYDLKLRQKVQIDESRVSKTTYESNGQVRYALRAKTDDDRNLTKFVNKETWDSMDVPVEESPKK